MFPYNPYGWNPYAVQGWSTMGGGWDTVGDDVLGDEMDDPEAYGLALEGAARAPMRRPMGRPALVKRAKPQWRQRLAPGVPVPGYGMVSLALKPNLNDGIFTSTVTNIEFLARPQFAFEGQRLLVNIRRSAGASAVRVLSNSLIFIGTRPQVGSLGDQDIEDFDRSAFGVRLKMEPTEPGGDVTMFVRASPTVAVGETVAVSIKVIGEVAR